MSESTNHPNPENIMQLGFGFWASKTLLSAVEMGLFTFLGQGSMTCEALQEKLGLNARSSRDFLDALVALRMLQRDGDLYANTSDTAIFLDRNKPSYIGGILEMANARLYPFWGSLTEGVRTGKPQNEAKTGGDFFAALYADQDRLRDFAHAMTGLSMGAAMAMAEKFPWDRYKTFMDVGAAEGGLPVQLAQRHPHLIGGGSDLPELETVFNAYVASFGLQDRLRFVANNFMVEALPNADVLIMGHILHDWGLDEKKMLLRKAYEVLPAGGALIVYEAIIDDARRENAFGLLMSLNMLIETPAGFDYTGEDCMGWMAEIGFKDMSVEHLAGPDSMVVGYK